MEDASSSNPLRHISVRATTDLAATATVTAIVPILVDLESHQAIRKKGHQRPNSKSNCLKSKRRKRRKRPSVSQQVKRKPDSARAVVLVIDHSWYGTQSPRYLCVNCIALSLLWKSDDDRPRVISDFLSTTEANEQSPNIDLKLFKR